MEEENAGFKRLVADLSLDEAQAILEAWRLKYNTRRPHSSLGHLTPNEFVAQRQGQPTIEEVVCSG